MFLVSLVYTSHSQGAVDVESILSSARRHNERAGVTGVLLFRAGHFLQCLEGGRDAVNETYWRILRDDRHSQPLLLSYAQIVERDFGDWSMGYLPDVESTRSTVLRYSRSPCLDPRAIDGESVRRLLRTLRDEVRVA